MVLLEEAPKTLWVAVGLSFSVIFSSTRLHHRQLKLGTVAVSKARPYWWRSENFGNANTSTELGPHLPKRSTPVWCLVVSPFPLHPINHLSVLVYVQVYTGGIGRVKQEFDFWYISKHSLRLGERWKILKQSCFSVLACTQFITMSTVKITSRSWSLA